MTTQPVLFVSHGSPMLALDPPDHPYAHALGSFARAQPERPRAVVTVSAHWQTRTPQVTASPRPGVMYDFSGFPPALSAVTYPAPGDPGLAAAIARSLGAAPDSARPLDHGAWAVLRHLFPDADVPVLQVSLPDRDPAGLVELGQALAPLRDEGVLILASGGLVHNLRTVDWSAPDEVVAPWAKEAEAWFLERLFSGRTGELLAHRDLWPESRRAAATTEHLDTVFAAMGAARPQEAPRTVFDGWQLGTMSLRCLAWG